MWSNYTFLWIPSVPGLLTLGALASGLDLGFSLALHSVGLGAFLNHATEMRNILRMDPSPKKEKFARHDGRLSIMAGHWCASNFIGLPRGRH